MRAKAQMAAAEESLEFGMDHHIIHGDDEESALDFLG